MARYERPSITSSDKPSGSLRSEPRARCMARQTPSLTPYRTSFCMLSVHDACCIYDLRFGSLCQATPLHVACCTSLSYLGAIINGLRNTAPLR